MVRPGPVRLEDGSQADLLDYALSHQNDLALKPTLLRGSHGVLLGWHAVDCRLSARAVRHRVITIRNGPLTIRCSGSCSACCSGRCRAAGHAEYVTTGSGLSQS